MGQPSWYSSLNLDPDPTSPGYGHTNDIIATVQGIFFAGGFFGCLFAGLVGNRLGRIRSFQVCSVICIVGGAIQTGATNQAMVCAEQILLEGERGLTIGQYIVARFITGFATGHAFSAMPVYFSEVSPPHFRGLMTGAHGCFINVGYATANWIGSGFARIR